MKNECLLSFFYVVIDAFQMKEKIAMLLLLSSTCFIKEPIKNSSLL